MRRRRENSNVKSAHPLPAPRQSRKRLCVRFAKAVVNCFKMAYDSRTKHFVDSHQRDERTIVKKNTGYCYAVQIMNFQCVYKQII